MLIVESPSTARAIGLKPEDMKSPVEVLWELLGGAPRVLESLSVSGGPWLPSVFDVTGLARDAVGVASLAAAELQAARFGGALPRAEVDSAGAAAAFRSEALLEPLGWERPPTWDPIAGDYRARDRFIRLHTNYASHRRAAERALGLPLGTATRDVVAAVVATRDASAIERDVVAEGGCAAAMCSRAEWLVHEHGATAKDEPPCSRTLHEGSALPLAPGRRGSAGGAFEGVRVLDLTRVLAGPVCTRFLAAHGAEVLRVDPPGFEEVPALLPDTTAGKRCTFLAIDTKEGSAIFAELLARADVLVHGLRPGALARLGFGPARLLRDYPSLVTAEVSAYGFAGPWSGRRGFDSLVQMSSGIACQPGGPGAPPKPLPAQALDHGAGYLLAAGVGRALTERLRVGRASSVRVSLVGVANHLFSRPAAPLDAPPGPWPEAVLEHAQTAWGPVRRVRCPGRVGGRSAEWAIPPGPLGAAQPAFL